MYPDYVHLKNLDNFFIQEGITNISFSRDQAVKWKQQLENESKSTQYDRINIKDWFGDFPTPAFLRFSSVNIYISTFFFGLQNNKSDYL